MTTRDWAPLYGSLGWRVFPVVSGEKRPLYKGWQGDATTDPEQIERYWRREPSPNIGVVCGEAFDVFDVEADHLPALRQRLTDRGHPLPVTPLARTGRGGIHLLVSPTTIGRGRDLHLGGVHIGELKSRGGFIVVAPSVTVAPYRWLRDPATVGLAPAPAWLLSLVEEPRPMAAQIPARGHSSAEAERHLSALTRAVANARRGKRNSVLYWAMRRALEEGLPLCDADVTMLAAALACGLSEREARATLRSATGASAAQEDEPKADRPWFVRLLPASMRGPMGDVIADRRWRPGPRNDSPVIPPGGIR